MFTKNSTKEADENSEIQDHNSILSKSLTTNQIGTHQKFIAND